MPVMPRRLATVVVVSLFGHVHDARADDKLECIAASDSAQQQRRAGHLVAARESLLMCVREACPGPVRAFCEQWLEEVQAGLPTILVRVADSSGHDVSAVRVVVDGVPIATELDGRPLTLDPGLHQFRFEPRQGAPVVDQLLIVESHKNRLVTETLPAGSASSQTEGPVGRVPLGTWILGAVGVAGVGGFAALAAAGSNSYASCVTSPCSSSTKSSLDLDRGLAWASLTVGALAAGGSVWMYFASKSKAPSRLGALTLTPAPSGGFVSWTGRF
jgi:hypothetical protein